MTDLLSPKKKKKKNTPYLSLFLLPLDKFDDQ